MRQNDRRRRLFKTFTACLLAVAMLLSNVGAMDVWAASVKKPSINFVKIGAKEVTGGNLEGPNKRKKLNKDCIIHVTVKDAAGIEKEKAQVSIPPKGGSTWKVTLENKVEAGWTVYAKQEFNGDFSDEESIMVKHLLADSYKDKLSMPELEVWSEDVHVIEADAVEDIVKAFTDKNNELENVDGKNFEENLYKPKNTSDKTKAIDVDGDGKHLTVTFSDESKIENIPTNVTVTEITEKSNPAEVENLTVVDGEIKGKISGDGPFNRARVTIVQFNNEDSKNNYCNSGKCTVDKNASKLATIFVDETTGEFTYQVTDNELLTLGKDIGITVKEYRKKNNCKTIQPSLVIPNVPVRDPKKVTKEEKDKIREEIRKANTTKGGTSKLPDWTAYNVPAIIDFDKDGNVKIINPSNVEGDWNDDYTKFVPRRKNDGSLEMKTGEENKVIPVEKDKLVTNLAPNQPTVKYDKENHVITVTPDPADTDAKKITVKYKDPDGNDQEVIVSKEDGENGKWKAPEGSKVTVNPDTGVVTIKDSDIQNKTNVSATVTDEGGIAANDTDEKTSKNESEQIKIYPKKPEITVNEDGSVTITPVDKDGDKVAKKMDITYIPVGKDDPVTVTAERNDEGKWSIAGKSDFKVSNDGKSITIANDKIKSETNITAQTNDGDADPGKVLKSDVARGQVPDKTAPQPPAVTVDTDNGNALIAPPADPDVKTIEVKYPGADGNEKTFTATKKGPNTWEITGNNGESIDVQTGKITIPYDKLKQADTISATATDVDGNESKPGTDISLPPAPSVVVDNNTGEVTITPPTDKAPAVDGMEITYTPATEGASETKLVAKKQDGKWSIENIPEGVTISQSTGVVTIAEGKAKEESKVTALSSIDTNKKSLEKAEGTVPTTTAPEAPVVKVQEDGSVKITPKNKGETTVTVTYKDQDGADKTATATKGKNGEWTVEGKNGETIDKTSGVITIPTGKTNPGDVVKATAKKGSKTSDLGKDTTKPAPPTVTPDQATGNVTITPPTKGNLDGMDINYKVPNGTERKVRAKKGTDGKWTIDGDNPDGVTIVEGTGVVTIPKGKAKEKTPVTADSTLGKLKTPNQNQGGQPALVPDKTPPVKPEVAVQEDGSVTITPPTDKDTTSVIVTYKDKDGNAKTATATKGDDGWSVAGDNGETVDKTSGVITIPKGNYKTDEAVNAAAKDPAGNESEKSQDTPVEISFDANTGTGSMNSLIVRKKAKFNLPANGFTAPEGKEFDGWDLNGQKVAAGTEVSVDGNMALKAVWKDKAKALDPKPERPDNSGRSSGFWFVPAPAEPEKEIGRHDRYLYGYEDKRVRPEGNITRAEAAALIARLAELDMSDKSKPNFVDTPSAWYNSAINIMVKKDLMFGDKNGNFRPAEPITRGEFARALLYIDATNDKVAPFADVKGHEFEAAINQAYGNNRISGYPDGTFRPDAYIQRAEAARILNQYANRGTTLEGMAPVAKDLIQFTDINPSHWAYCEVMEAANTHEYERVKGTQAETWLRILNDEMKR